MRPGAEGRVGAAVAGSVAGPAGRRSGQGRRCVPGPMGTPHWNGHRLCNTLQKKQCRGLPADRARTDSVR